MTRKAINDLRPGTEYAVQVRAVGADAVSEWSRVFSVSTIIDTTKPKIPANVVWDDSGDSFHGEWDSVTENVNDESISIDHYDVELVADGVTKVTSLASSSGRVVFDLSFEANRALFTTAEPIIALRVRAVGSGVVGDYSAPITATNPVPAPVTGLTGTPIIDGVFLKWTAPADTDVVGYNLYVGTSSNPTNKVNNQPISSTEYNYGSTTYTNQFFKVTAVDAFAQESTGTETNATPTSPFGGGDSTPPAAPTAFAVDITTDPNGILLTQTASATWTAAADTTLAGFIIRYKENGTTSWNYTSAPPDAQQPFVITRFLEPDLDYDFEIRAFDTAGLKSSWVALMTNAETPSLTPELLNALVISAGGYITSADYTIGGTLGWRIDEDGVVINTGIISADTLQGGQIQSTEFATKWDSTTQTYVEDNTLPAWYIDLEGDASFNRLQVRGNVVVGDVTETPSVDAEGDQSPDGERSTLASGNYISGVQGWMLRSDGYAEFRNMLADSIEGDAIKADTLDVNTLKSDSSLDKTIKIKGALTAENEDVTSAGYGSTVSLSGEGFFVKGPDSAGNPDYIVFPTSGAPNIISGTLQASTLSVSGGASFRGISHFELSSELTLDNAVASPIAAPTVTESVPSFKLSGTPAGIYPTSDYLGMKHHNNALHFNYYAYNAGPVYRVYRYDDVTGAYLGVTPVAEPAGEDDPVFQDFTRHGSFWYVLWTFTTGTGTKIIQYNDSWVATGLSTSVTPITSHPWQGKLASDGTNLVHFNMNPDAAGSARNPKVRKFNPTTLAVVGADVTLTTAPPEPGDARSNLGVRGFEAGTFDYGSSYTYVVAWDNNETTAVYAYDDTGVRQTNREWPVEAISSGMFSFAVDRANNYFYHMSSVEKVYEYSGQMWTTESSAWWWAYSYYNLNGRSVSGVTTVSGSTTINAAAGSFVSTDVGADVSGTNIQAGTKINSIVAGGAQAVMSLTASGSGTNALNVTYETTYSPLGSIAVRKRRRQWSVTGSGGPTGTVLRFYAGRKATTPTTSELFLQGTMAGGIITDTRATATFSGTNPKAAGLGTFAAGLPARVYSQQTDTLTINNVNITNGSTTLTNSPANSAFFTFFKDAIVTGPGIPAGTKIVSITNANNMVMSTTATSTTASATITIIRPSIELRGDGYARISQLYAQQTILTSETDVNALAGNTPPLRVGDINGNHLRIDGNEFQAMGGDAATGTINLQQGGGGVTTNGATQYNMFGKTFKKMGWDTTSITTGAGGQDAISHGLGVVPDMVLVTVNNTSNPRYALVTARTATTFTVLIMNSVTNAPQPNTGLSINWMAIGN